MKKLGIAIRCALLTLCLPTWCFAEKVTWHGMRTPRPTVTGYRVSYGTASGVHPTTLDVGNTRPRRRSRGSHRASVTTSW